MTSRDREVGRTRADFDRELLEWDFLAAWEEENKPTPSSLPSSSSNGNDKGEEEEDGREAKEEETEDGEVNSGPKPVQRWTPVPDTFSSASHYVDVWFPLLLQEMRAETLSDIGTEGVGPFTKVQVEGGGDGGGEGGRRGWRR